MEKIKAVIEQFGFAEPFITEAELRTGMAHVGLGDGQQLSMSRTFVRMALLSALGRKQGVPITDHPKEYLEQAEEILDITTFLKIKQALTDKIK